jgi:hypothetical protein
MTTELKKSALYSENPRFSVNKEIVNREYAKSTVDSHRGLSGTVIKSATTTDVGSVGAQFDMHPKDPLPFYATVQGEDGKEMEVYVTARAHRLLRKHNRNGEVKIGFVEAVRMAAEEEKLEKQGVLVNADTVPPLPEMAGTDTGRPLGEPRGEEGPVGLEEPASSAPVRRSRRPKLPEMVMPLPAKLVHVTIEGPAGSVVLRARDVFIGGPSGMCLVVVQDQQYGTVYLPPVKTEEPDEFTISFNGEVYKAISALYYQLPGTTIYHAVYLVV